MNGKKIQILKQGEPNKGKGEPQIYPGRVAKQLIPSAEQKASNAGCPGIAKQRKQLFLPEKGDAEPTAQCEANGEPQELTHLPLFLSLSFENGAAGKAASFSSYCLEDYSLEEIKPST